LETSVPEQSDEEAIWRIIIDDHAAWWMRDFDTYAAFHLQSPDDSWWAAIMTIGITRHNGWDALRRHVASEFADDAEPNPYLAYGTRFEQRMLRIWGETAWAKFDAIFPTADLPDFHGPAIAHEIRILERHEGVWKIVLVALMDDQFGQSDTPMWQIDTNGKVLAENPAATRYMRNETESEYVVRAGRAHFRDSETDGRLREAVGWVSKADGGIMAPSVATPVVFDPGNDLPARIWWVNARSGRMFIAFNDQSLLPPRIERASIAFGLSPAQHRLALSVVEGLSLIEAAKREGVRISTARTQLQRIFDKVGVRTQAALVRALLSVAQGA
jgi:DNA-binding CsgD family transcriptional regulator